MGRAREGEGGDMQTELRLYCKSMGKVFPVRRICRTDAEANEYCARNRDVGVIAEDTEMDLIFLADLHPLQVRADVLPD